MVSIRTRKHLYTRTTNFSSPVGRRRPVSLTMSAGKQAFRQVPVDDVGLLDNIVRSSTAPGRHGWQRSAPLGRKNFEFPPGSSRLELCIEFLERLVTSRGDKCLEELRIIMLINGESRFFLRVWMFLPPGGCRDLLSSLGGASSKCCRTQEIIASSSVLASKWGWDSEFVGTVLTSGRDLLVWWIWSFKRSGKWFKDLGAAGRGDPCDRRSIEAKEIWVFGFVKEGRNYEDQSYEAVQAEGGTQ